MHEPGANPSLRTQSPLARSLTEPSIPPSWRLFLRPGPTIHPRPFAGTREQSHGRSGRSRTVCARCRAPMGRWIRRIARPRRRATRRRARVAPAAADCVRRRRAHLARPRHRPQPVRDHVAPGPRRDVVLLLDGQHDHRAWLPRGPGRPRCLVRWRCEEIGAGPGLAVRAQGRVAGDVWARQRRGRAGGIRHRRRADCAGDRREAPGPPGHQHRRGSQRDGQRRRQGGGGTAFPGNLLSGRPGAGRGAPRRLDRCRHRGRLRRYPHCRG